MKVKNKLILHDNKMKVLLVENNKKLSNKYKTELLNENFEVFRAKDGIEINDMINKHNIEIIVSDTDLPKMDGDIACKNLLKTGKIKDILIIGMSSVKDCEEYWKGIAFEFLYKYKMYNLGKIVKSIHKRYLESKITKVF